MEFEADPETGVGFPIRPSQGSAVQEHPAVGFAAVLFDRHVAAVSPAVTPRVSERDRMIPNAQADFLGERRLFA